MQTNIETLTNCKTILTLKADKEEWGNKIEKAYAKLESKVSLKGFRKGKAPKELLRSRVSQEDVFNEALNSFLSENFTKAIQENNLHPYMQPTVEVKKISNEEVECALTIIGEPSVKLNSYKGLTIAKDEVTVTDEEINHEIKHLQEQNAEIVVKEEGTVEKGNIVTIDFEGFVDGVAFDGGKASDYDLEIGSNTFIPGFEDQIIGMSANETKDINVTFPQNYVENLKGKPAVFKVTVKAIKNKVYPEINDDLALDANLDDVETLEQLKTYYKNQITTRKETEANNAAYTKLIDTIMDQATIEIAPELIEDEVHHNVENIEARLSQQGLNLDGYLNMLSMDKADFMSKLESDCTKNIKYMFTLLAVAKSENIKVTEDDYNQAYQDMANQYKMDVEDVKKALANRVEALANDLLTKKVSEFLKKENNI